MRATRRDSGLGGGTRNWALAQSHESVLAHERPLLTVLGVLLQKLNMSYLLSNLILGLAGDTKRQRNTPEVALSRDVLEPKLGRPSRQDGAILPLAASGLGSEPASAGGFTVQTTITDRITAAVRAQSTVMQLGARSIPNARYALRFPVCESGSRSVWMGEASGSDAASTDPVFSARTLVPHALVTSAAYSRDLLVQGDAIEQFLIDDIGGAVAAEIDRAALVGTGAVNETIGLLNMSRTPVVAIGTNGGPITADLLYQLEETIGKANLTPTGFLCTPSLKRVLKKTPVIASGYEPIWSDETGGVLGVTSLTSTNCPSALTKGTSVGTCHAAILGAWGQMLIATWDYELVVDKYTRKKSGNIEVTIYTSVDFAVLHEGGFAVIADATIA